MGYFYSPEQESERFFSDPLSCLHETFFFLGVLGVCYVFYRVFETPTVEQYEEELRKEIEESEMPQEETTILEAKAPRKILKARRMLSPTNTSSAADSPFQNEYGSNVIVKRGQRQRKHYPRRSSDSGDKGNWWEEQFAFEDEYFEDAVQFRNRSFVQLPPHIKTKSGKSINNNRVTNMWRMSAFH